MTEEKQIIIEIEKNFSEIVEKLKEDFESKHGLRISSKQATKIIADRINKVGGIKL